MQCNVKTIMQNAMQTKIKMYTIGWEMTYEMQYVTSYNMLQTPIAFLRY
jgi:hypothetical protein